MTLSVAVLSLHTSPLAQPGTGDGGGMNVYVRELSTALARAGVSCEVFTRTPDGARHPVVNVEPGLRVHNIDVGPEGPVPKELLVDHLAEFTDAVQERLALHDLRPNLIHANYWLSAVAGHTLKHRLDIPLVVTFHTLQHVKSLVSDSSDPARALAEETVAGCTDLVLANTPVERRELEDLYGVDPARIEVVPLGVDHAFFSPGNRAAAKAALRLGDHPVVLCCGRIQALKGTELAIRAFAAMRTRGAVLVLVGGPSGVDGDHELNRIHALAAELGVSDRIRWVPPLAHHVLSTYYRAADVCVVPSHAESFGLVALEAGACGTPVVATNVGGLATLIDHARTGFLVDGRDPHVWASYLDDITSNPRLGAAMGARAAQRSQRYAWSYSGARLRRLYADLTSRCPVDACP